MVPRISLALTILILLAGCSTPTSKVFNVTIDWVPSPEYYGFFYARDEGLYKDEGLNVKINYGAGAPAVAAEIAAGAVYAGTTTSDNVLRQVARGAEFQKAVALLKFNPAVIASLADKPVSRLSDLPGKVLGTNKQASVYQQLLYLIRKGKLEAGTFKEYPIGFGGAVQLLSGEVDAILAYTTNVVVDLELEKGIDAVTEIMFAKEEVFTYGLVLVIGPQERVERSGFGREDIQKFINATTKGYKQGADKIEDSIKALMGAEPTLNPRKIKRAIEKIKELNRGEGYPLEKLDKWVDDQSIERVRDSVAKLYER